MKIIAYISIAISIILFWRMVDIIVRTIGVQPSISAAYKKLRWRNRRLINFTLIFFAQFLLLGFLLLNYHLFEEGKYRDILFIFFACLGISFTGAAYAYAEKKITNIFHLVGVYVAVILGYLYLAFNFQFYLIGISLIAIFLSHRYSPDNYTFFDEIIAFVSIVYGIILISM